MLKLTLCAMLLCCAGCTASIVTDGCRIFKPISGSSQDTTPTRNQVDEHNARGVGACGWKP